MPVQLPDIDPRRKLARRLFDAIVSQVPVFGGYAAMLSVTHPPQVEQLQAAWQSNITEAVNQIEQIIDQLLPAITLSAAASAIGVWISRTSINGRGESVEFTELRRAFPEASKLELEDACGELEYAGLATASGAIGHKILYVNPTVSLFEIFDPVVFDVSPRADAAHLARYILSQGNTVGAEDVMKNFGWDMRRFNPAIGIVCSMIGNGRKSAEIHPEIACLYVMPNSQERAALRQFANLVLGPE